MILFLARLFGMPVDIARYFPDQASTFVAEPGQIMTAYVGRLLEGDPDVPLTSLPGNWAVFNTLRNLYLANFVWKTYSLLRIEASTDQEFRLAFGQLERWQMMPRKLAERYIAVKHGREECRFVPISTDGEEIFFYIIGRGSKEEILKSCVDDLRKHMPSTPVSIDQIENFITFV